MPRKAMVPSSRRPPRRAGSAWHVAEVVSHLPGTNQISVRLSNQSGRATQNVIAAVGQNFRGGDRALVVRASGETAWIAVVKVRDSKETGMDGLYDAPGAMLHAPTNFTVTGFTDAILAGWEAWPGAVVCFELQVNDSASEEGATTVYTRGSYYIQAVTRPTTKYIRARSILYFPDVGEISRSGWTGWDSATAPGPHLANGIQQLEWDELMTRHIIQGA